MQLLHSVWDMDSLFSHDGKPTGWYEAEEDAGETGRINDTTVDDEEEEEDASLELEMTRLAERGTQGKGVENTGALQQANQSLQEAVTKLRERSKTHIFRHNFRLFFIFGLLDNIIATALLGLSSLCVHETEGGALIPLVCDPVNICASLAAAHYFDARDTGALRANPPDPTTTRNLTILGGLVGVVAGILCGLMLQWLSGLLEAAL